MNNKSLSQALSRGGGGGGGGTRAGGGQGLSTFLSQTPLVVHPLISIALTDWNGLE